MQFVIRLVISVAVIIATSHIGRKFSSLVGLIAVMPLTGVIVMLWIYSYEPQNVTRMTEYSKAALLGIIPSILFFVVAFLCFRKQLPLWMVLGFSFGAWLAVAVVHQLLLVFLMLGFHS